MEISSRTSGRKPTKLRTLFLRYLAVFCAGTIGLTLVLALLFVGGMYSGMILPANYAEKQAIEASSAIAAGQQPEKDSSYALYKYAKYTLDGGLLEHNLSDKQANFAWGLLEDQNSSYTPPYNYMKTTHQQEVYILRYSLTAQFSNPLLRSLVPSAEFFFFVVFCVAFLGGAALLASSFGRKLARKMNGLQETTQLIQQQNLDFTVQYSGIAEIDRVLHSMDQMKHALKQSLERQWKLERSRRDQISALAHDVKTPLTIVRGNVELLTETSLTEEQKEYTDYITESTRQMEAYIKSLIEMTKTESSTSLQLATVDLRGFIRKIEGQMQALAVVKELTPHVIAHDLPDTMQVDPELLERALMNIISNAVDQAPRHSELSLLIDYTQERIRFCVLDQGPGFSTEALKLATEQFYMGDPARRAKGHYGMGLYIASFITSLHGGELHVANDPTSGGGKVTIELPHKPLPQM